MQPVSLTAQWTAAVRALESERADPLFRDDLARELANPGGFHLLDRYKGAGVQEFIAIRTKYFDDAVHDIMAQNAIEQVVLVAAGMDTRAFRLNWPDGSIVYELDHQALLQEKALRLSALGRLPSVARIPVPTDFTDAWVQSLYDAGFEPSARTLWLAEGLVFFLTPEQAQLLFKTLREASQARSWLVVDMASEALLKSPISQAFLSVLKSDGVPWRFGTDEPELFLSRFGWKVRDLKEPGQAGAGEGRWPYRVPPRDFKGAPRSWLIRAEAQGVGDLSQ